MKCRSIISIILLLPSVALAAATQKFENKTPRLAVLLVVDQMRPDYLTRFAGYYHGGLARIIRDASLNTVAIHSHAMTETSPGHATIATGCFPSHHGIVSNEFYDTLSRKEIYSVEDLRDTGRIVGATDLPGRSPENLLRTTLGDWLKADVPTAKVYSVSWKDRAAILTGGKSPDGAFWVNEKAHGFVTSRYYCKNLPLWVDSFNRGEKPYTYSKVGWGKLLPEESYYNSSEDNFPSESDGKNTIFPHNFAGPLTDTTSYFRQFGVTPYADKMVIKFAIELARREHLGADNACDLLCVSLSAADKIGHRYGPMSQEVQDYYLRLDEFLGEFLTGLDSLAGDRWILALSADHGVLPLPEELQRRGIDSKRLYVDSLAADFHAIEKSICDSLQIADSLFGFITNDFTGIVFNRTTMNTHGLKIVNLSQLFASSFKKLSYVADVFTFDQLLARDTLTQSLAPLYAHNFCPSHAADLIIAYKKNYLVSWSPYGTSHGSPYDYDMRVPFVLCGSSGSTWGPFRPNNGQALTVDIAPTLANLMRIKAPADIDGKSALR